MESDESKPTSSGADEIAAVAVAVEDAPFALTNGLLCIGGDWTVKRRLAVGGCSKTYVVVDMARAVKAAMKCEPHVESRYRELLCRECDVIKAMVRSPVPQRPLSPAESVKLETRGSTTPRCVARSTAASTCST